MSPPRGTEGWTVACAVDGAFAPHCATMLHSLVTSNRHRPLTVYCLHENLPTQDLARLKHVVEQGVATFVSLPVPTPWVERLPPHSRFSKAAGFRLLLPALLPELDRILYLDSDVVVMDDLMPLWKTDLSRKCLAAVTQPHYPWTSWTWILELGLGSVEQYFNSGVLLMNLDELRLGNRVAQLIEYLARHATRYYDQDALNAVLARDWLPLHPRWNAQNMLFELAPRHLPYDRQAIAEARSRPAVVHFIGPIKPWHYRSNHPLRRLYFRHRAATPWPPFAYADRSITNFVMRWIPQAQWYRIQLAWSALKGRVRSAIRSGRRKA